MVDCLIQDLLIVGEKINSLIVKKEEKIKREMNEMCEQVFNEFKPKKSALSPDLKLDLSNITHARKSIIEHINRQDFINDLNYLSQDEEFELETSLDELFYSLVKFLKML